MPVLLQFATQHKLATKLQQLLFILISIVYQNFCDTIGGAAIGAFDNGSKMTKMAWCKGSGSSAVALCGAVLAGKIS
jgi:hypothetical protein